MPFRENLAAWTFCSASEAVFTILRHEAKPDHGDLVIPVDELEGVNAVKGAVGIAGGGWWLEK